MDATTPSFIVTDSKALSFLNNALLLGQLDFTSGGLTIRIYCPDELIK